MNKRQLVKQHLETHGSITPAEARELYGSDRLSSIIFHLRDTGMEIETEMTNGKDHLGNKVRFAKYIYEKED